MEARTDRNNNPAAFTTDVAKEAGLTEGVDYEVGDPFPTATGTEYTAKLLGDPVALTIKAIDAIGFYEHKGTRPQRWSYIGMPDFVWAGVSPADRVRVIGFMYEREGGTELKPLFASNVS